MECLHNYERPISYLAYQNAEINRDRKKQRKPFKVDDFYIYKTKESEELPEPKYGAAALALISKRLFPSWALFVYNDLKARAGNASPPEVLCLQCDDAIMLAPDIENGVITGMLIAMETASGEIRTLTSPCGHKIVARMPLITEKVTATEDAEMRLLDIISSRQPVQDTD